MQITLVYSGISYSGAVYYDVVYSGISYSGAAYLWAVYYFHIWVKIIFSGKLRIPILPYLKDLTEFFLKKNFASVRSRI